MDKNEILQNLRKNYEYYRNKAADHFELGKYNYYYQNYEAKTNHYYALMKGVEKLHETKHVVKHEALNLQRVSQQSELLSNFASYLNETYNLNIEIDDQDVETFNKIAL